MTKRPFDKIAAGLRDAAAIQRGEMDPATYRVHVPTSGDEKALADLQRRKPAIVAKQKPGA
jgi:putative transcriptional regulator